MQLAAIKHCVRGRQADDISVFEENQGANALLIAGFIISNTRCEPTCLRSIVTHGFRPSSKPPRAPSPPAVSDNTRRHPRPMSRHSFDREELAGSACAARRPRHRTSPLRRALWLEC